MGNREMLEENERRQQNKSIGSALRYKPYGLGVHESHNTLIQVISSYISPPLFTLPLLHFFTITVPILSTLSYIFLLYFRQRENILILGDFILIHLIDCYFTHSKISRLKTLVTLILSLRQVHLC